MHKFEFRFQKNEQELNGYNKEKEVCHKRCTNFCVNKPAFMRVIFCKKTEIWWFYPYQKKQTVCFFDENDNIENLRTVLFVKENVSCYNNLV